VKFFFDNCISPRIVRALKVLSPEDSIQHLREKFPEAAKDIEWIVPLGREGDWIVFSLDKIWRVPQQKQALKEAKVVCFFFLPGWNQEFWVQVGRLFTLWPLFPKTVADSKPGDCYRVPSKGQLFEKFSL
jgi:hypothetical protein